MDKFPLFSIFPSSYFTQDAKKRLAGIRNNVLQSQTTFHFFDWNKNDLFRSIGTRKSPPCFIGLASLRQEGDGFVVPLNKNEAVTLEDLISDIQKSHRGLIFIVILTDNLEESLVTPYLTEIVPDNCLLLTIQNDLNFFAFAACFELTNWWGMQSSLAYHISYSELSSAIETLVTAYAEVAEDAFSFEFIAGSFEKDATAWQGGEVYAAADIDKIANSARKEQLLDTIKRITDDAKHLRLQHMPTHERLICSQGLFWLCQNSGVIDIDNWLQDTRFYIELNPSIEHRAVENLVADELMPELNIDIAALFEMFVKIPAGRYVFGSNDKSIESEPPTKEFEAELASFLILKQKVTMRIWNRLVSNKKIAGDEDMPVTDLTYFEALAFAKMIKRLIGQEKYEVRLPTEFEWEAAARGFDGRRYPWGNSFIASAANCEMMVGAPTKVGAYSPIGDSPFGCQDMAGNVREWTSSYAGTRGVDWAEAKDISSPADQTIGLFSRVIIRGGSYSYSEECVQSWVRNTQIASRRDLQTGFRLIITEP